MPQHPNPNPGAGRTSIAGILAIEVVPEGAPAQLRLSIESAALLADLLADDLQRVLPGVDRFGLAIAAALYDQAQLLRPGFPVHAALAELYDSEPKARATASIMAFGQSAGQMAKVALEPDPGLIGSPLLLLPFSLQGARADAPALVEHMENEWQETALASARLALFLNEAFSIKTEHARFMTLHDLCAICSVQYAEAGLDSVWALIECALLSPHRTEQVTSPRGVRWRFQQGIATASAPTDARQAEECRQFVAILAAHGIDGHPASA